MGIDYSDRKLYNADRIFFLFEKRAGILRVQCMQSNERSNSMKFLDCHMHQGLVRVPVETFLDRLDAAGVDSAIVFSYPPAETG